MRAAAATIFELLFLTLAFLLVIYGLPFVAIQTGYIK